MGLPELHGRSVESGLEGCACVQSRKQQVSRYPSVSGGGIPQVGWVASESSRSRGVGVIPQVWGGDGRRLRVPGVGSLSQ